MLGVGDERFDQYYAPGFENGAACPCTELYGGSAFLAAQTLECALKSYLSHAGIPQKKLKCRPLRHNLENLWIEAVNKGLNVQAQAPQWCLILNSAHDEPYYFRYPMGLNVTTLPALVPMASELEMVLAVVEKSI
jgi:hypothetical protein